MLARTSAYTCAHPHTRAHCVRPPAQGLVPKTLELLETWHEQYKAAARAVQADASREQAARTLQVRSAPFDWTAGRLLGAHTRAAPRP